MMIVLMVMMMPLTVITWLSHSMIRLWRKMQRPARIHVVSDGLKYAASAIVSLQLTVHPKLFLSRNAQQITDEMAHTVQKDLLQRFKTKNLIFSPENVIACITAYLNERWLSQIVQIITRSMASKFLKHFLETLKSENINCCPENVEACAAAYIREGPLLKFGLIEANKKEEDGQTSFLEHVTSFVQHENIPTSEVREDRKKALIMLAKFMKYLLAKILEMSGKY